jgi:hypothetical protein
MNSLSAAELFQTVSTLICTAGRRCDAGLISPAI